jgi:hypothetical protein
MEDETKPALMEPERAEEFPLLLAHSPVFESDHPIPADYTQDGENWSPPVAWANVPARTRSFALIAEEVDGPRSKAAVHWILFNIPRTPRSELPKGISPAGRPPEVPGAAQGRNDFGDVGYAGPRALRSERARRYRFQVFALDTMLEAGPGADRDTILGQMKGHIRARGEFTGTYGRPERG